jgi:hypothetical protein
VRADIPSTIRKRLILLASRGRKTFLGPKKPLKNAIGDNLTWRLFVNVTKEELQDSAGLGLKQTAKKEK